MTSKEIAIKLAERNVVSSITEGKNMVDAIIDIMVGELLEGGDVFLADLGRLYPHETTARKGSNPATGAEIKIPAKTVIKFRPAGRLKK
jgi:DNA-binding protein HU-beta